MLLNSLLDRRVVFFGGKGGVGKTTCSTAFALAASRSGRRVLLVSTDPAHSTSDVLERAIGPGESEIAPGFWALEIDAQRESERYVERVKRDIERMFGPSVVRQAHRQVDMAAASPGLSDVALLDRIVDLIADGDGRFDAIVVDTAPTGHTLQLMRLPDVMDAWIRALVKHRRALLEIDRGGESAAGAEPDADPVIATLERRRERLNTLRARVLDRASTAFVLVAIPERLAIEETARAAAALRDTGLEVAALIVNRILPEGLEGEFYRLRKNQETRYLDEIARRFAGLRRADVRQLPQDVCGLVSLTTVSRQLVAEDL